MTRTHWISSVLLAIGCGAADEVDATKTKTAGPIDDTAVVDSGGVDSGPGTHETGAPDTGDPPPAALHVLLANVGNLDEAAGGPCPAEPYRGSTCSMAQEAVIAASLRDQAPDVVIILEALDADGCGPDTWDGDADLACTGAPGREPYQQVRRLLGPDYTISCDDRSHRSCIGVRMDRILLAECPPGDLCIGGSTTAPHPEDCGSLGTFTSVSRVDATWVSADGPLPVDSPFTIVAAHALNATDETGDPCRRAHYQSAFEGLPGSGPTLIAGDMNMDPYRFPDLFPSAVYWHTQVGDDARYSAHSVSQDPPTPTWLDLATLDYVLSDFLSGSCTVLTGTDRVDGDLATMDHRAVNCRLNTP